MFRGVLIRRAKTIKPSSQGTVCVAPYGALTFLAAFSLPGGAKLCRASALNIGARKAPLC